MSLGQWIGWSLSSPMYRDKVTDWLTGPGLPRVYRLPATGVTEEPSRDPNLLRRLIRRQARVIPPFTPDEVRNPPQNRELLFLAGRRPIVADKLRYYDDPEFAGSFDPA